MTTMSIRTLLTFIGRSATALAIAAGLAVFAARAEPTDAEFMIARDAFRANDAARLDRIAPRLKGHLLESYVEYWQLRLTLDDADPEPHTLARHETAGQHARTLQNPHRANQNANQAENETADTHTTTVRARVSHFPC